MEFKMNGIILRKKQAFHEDKIITVLSELYGVIDIIIKRKEKQLNIISEVLSFCSFYIYKKKDNYFLKHLYIKESFYSLSSDLEKFTISSYFSEIIIFLLSNENNTKDYIYLLMNSLFLIKYDKRDIIFIKFVFELKIIALEGFMPDISYCKICGVYEDKFMFFCVLEGFIYCQKCNKSNSSLVKISLSILKAMRFILYSDIKKIFNFNLSDLNKKILSSIIERYFINNTSEKFKSLEIYKSLNNNLNGERNV